MSLFFAVLAIGYHTLRGPDSMPPSDALAISDGFFERARLLAFTCIDAPNHYLVATLSLLSHFSFGYMRFRTASLHASLAWRLARACGISLDDGDLGSLCAQFRHFVCTDLDQLRVPTRLLPRDEAIVGRTITETTAPTLGSRANELGHVSAPHVAETPTAARTDRLAAPPPTINPAAPAPQLLDWGETVGPIAGRANNESTSTGERLGSGVKTPLIPLGLPASDSAMKVGVLAPCEALTPREIDSSYINAAKLCDVNGGRLTLHGSRAGAISIATNAIGGVIELSARYLDLRLSEVLSIVVSRMVLLRRGLLTIDLKRDTWLLVDELVEISALHDVAVPLAKLANIYGLKSITARQAGQHANAQLWAVAAIGLWRQVPVTQIAHAFQLGFIARHVALIALSGELQAASTAYIDSSVGATSRSGESSCTTARSPRGAEPTRASAESPAPVAGLSSRASSGFEIPSGRQAPNPGVGLAPLSEYPLFASIATMFSLVAHYWPVHAQSYDGLLTEATAMLQGANDSIARTLGVPAFQAPAPVGRPLSTLSASAGGGPLPASPVPEDASARGSDDGLGGSAAGSRPSRRRGTFERSSTRRFGAPRATGVAGRGESLMTSLVLESLRGEDQAGLTALSSATAPAAATPTLEKKSSRSRIIASPLDLLCMVIRQEQPLAVPSTAGQATEHAGAPAPPIFSDEVARQSPPRPSLRAANGGHASSGGLSARRGGQDGAVAAFGAPLGGPSAASWPAATSGGAPGDLTMRVLPGGGGLGDMTMRLAADREARGGASAAGGAGIQVEDDFDSDDDDDSILRSPAVPGPSASWPQLPTQPSRQFAATSTASIAVGLKRPRNNSDLLPSGPPHRNVPLLRLGSSSLSLTPAQHGGTPFSVGPPLFPEDTAGFGTATSSHGGITGVMRGLELGGIGAADSTWGVLSDPSSFLAPPTARLTDPPLLDSSEGGSGLDVSGRPQAAVEVGVRGSAGVSSGTWQSEDLS